MLPRPAKPYRWDALKPPNDSDLDAWLKNVCGKLRQKTSAQRPKRATAVWFSASQPLLGFFVSSSIAKPISITVSDTVRVSGLLQKPPHARACYVLAHGAGAGMSHPFMAAVAVELARRGIATLRYQFPFMERHARRPDPPQLAQATVRAAVAAALDLLPEHPLIAGGKSFGGRMTSQAQAKAPLIRPVAHRRSAPRICSTYKSRCCSCKERATLWRRLIKLSRFARNLASAQR